LVFVTKYRRRVITDRVRATLEASMRRVCSDSEAELLEIDGEDDHLQLLIAHPPRPPSPGS
jgi:putative transposase